MWRDFIPRPQENLRKRSRDDYPLSLSVTRRTLAKRQFIGGIGISPYETKFSRIFLSFCCDVKERYFLKHENPSQKVRVRHPYSERLD